MREMAFLNAGLKIIFTDEREEREPQTFYFEGGIAEFVTYLARGKSPLHPEPIHFAGEREMADGETVEMRLRCNTTTAIKRRFSRLPTRSTQSMVALTSLGSARH